MEARRVLVPVAGQPVDREALELASLLTRQTKGHIFVVYVIEVAREHAVDADIPQATARAERVLQEAEELLARLRNNHTHTLLLQARETGPAVVKEAVEREADLLVIGMPYRRRHGAFCLGETIPYLLQHAPCPVIVVREALHPPVTSPFREPARTRG